MANENKTFFADSVSNGKKFNWKDIFSAVFQKHSKDDLDSVFASGLRGHIPADNRLLEGWQRPWVFSRFLLFGLIAWLIIAIFAQVTANMYTTYGAMLLVPTALVPLTVAIFFWEMNIPRNIPIYDVLKFFIIGGIGAGIVFFFIYQFINNKALSKDNFMFWIIVGIVEELTKLLIIAFAMRKQTYCWGLNGFVIGAAVGAGFAVFETVGYVFDSLAAEGIASAMDLITGRGITSVAGHVAFATLYAAALALAKGRQKLDIKHFGNPVFLLTFLASIMIHAVFDYFPYIVVNLFGSPAQGISKILLNSGILTYFLMAIIFAIPEYAIILWLLRKSVKQVVDYSGTERQHHVNQVTPDSGNAQAVNAASSSAGVMILECVSGELAGQRFTVRSGNSVSIGRGNQNNVQYSDTAKGISRSHCRVAFDGSRILVTDVGSSHGTFFSNGARLQPNMQNPLNNGDAFYLASPKNTFRVYIR